MVYLLHLRSIFSTFEGFITFVTATHPLPHQYGISMLVSQTSFGGETSDSVAKCRLFSQVS